MDLGDLPNNFKPIGYERVLKIKSNSRRNVEQFKARLVAKGFPQREWFDFNHTFSSVSSKDSFRIVKALVP